MATRLTFGEERIEGFGPLPKWVANRRAWFEDNQRKEGKPKPRYRASPTEIKNLHVRAMALKGSRVFRLVA